MTLLLMMTASHSQDTDARFFRETGPAADIAQLVEPVLEELGLRLVRVTVSARDGGTVQIMADRQSGMITVEDCAIASRAISPLLDAHDPISGSYHLEVSSPGIDRPLVRAGDLEAWAGFEAKVELRQPIDGRKRFRGEIEGHEDGELRLRVDLGTGHGMQTLGLPLELIDTAKLVMTDALLKSARARQAEDDART